MECFSESVIASVFSLVLTLFFYFFQSCLASGDGGVGLGADGTAVAGAGGFSCCSLLLLVLCGSSARPSWLTEPRRNHCPSHWHTGTGAGSGWKETEEDEEPVAEAGFPVGSKLVL
jgi:hypothetical protein